MPRPKEPTQLKIAKDNPGHRPLNIEDEPVFAEGLPHPPDWLNDRAKEIWFAIAPMLVKSRVATQIDARPFASLCDAYATEEECVRVLNEAEPYVDTARGALQRHPAIQHLRDTRDQIRKTEAQFGIGAGNRAKVKLSLTPEAKANKDFF